MSPLDRGRGGGVSSTAQQATYMSSLPDVGDVAGKSATIKAEGGDVFFL